jgi:hypothetical protein
MHLASCDIIPIGDLEDYVNSTSIKGSMSILNKFSDPMFLTESRYEQE